VIVEEGRITEEEHRELETLIARTNKDKPKANDVKALRAMLVKHPRLWHTVGDLAVQNQQKILRDTKMSVAARELTDSAVNNMRRELGYKDASMLEQMLIEQVLLSWLRLNLWEYHVTEMSSASLPVADFWERRLSAAQRRYLRACETLARVRRLSRITPALQVNIATRDGQQVNIAGDFVKSSEGG
jgi:hypothetical protein